GGVIVVVLATSGAAAAGNGKDWIAPIVALVGAVFVAVLTAITTNRRQAAQLAAEDRRPRRELNHAPDLGELAHLRQFFDALAAAFEEQLTVADEFALFALTTKRHSNAPPETIPELEALAIRLATDHAVTRAFATVCKAAGTRDRALRGMLRTRTYDVSEA